MHYLFQMTSRLEMYSRLLMDYSTNPYFKPDIVRENDECV